MSSTSSPIHANGAGSTLPTSAPKNNKAPSQKKISHTSCIKGCAKITSTVATLAIGIILIAGATVFALGFIGHYVQSFNNVTQFLGPILGKKVASSILAGSFGVAGMIALAKLACSKKSASPKTNPQVLPSEAEEPKNNPTQGNVLKPVTVKKKSRKSAPKKLEKNPSSPELPPREPKPQPSPANTAAINPHMLEQKIVTLKKVSLTPKQMARSTVQEEAGAPIVNPTKNTDKTSNTPPPPEKTKPLPPEMQSSNKPKPVEQPRQSKQPTIAQMDRSPLPPPLPPRTSYVFREEEQPETQTPDVSNQKQSSMPQGGTKKIKKKNVTFENLKQPEPAPEKAPASNEAKAEPIKQPITEETETPKKRILSSKSSLKNVKTQTAESTEASAEQPIPLAPPPPPPPSPTPAQLDSKPLTPAILGAVKLSPLSKDGNGKPTPSKENSSPFKALLRKDTMLLRAQQKKSDNNSEVEETTTEEEWDDPVDLNTRTSPPKPVTSNNEEPKVTPVVASAKPSIRRLVRRLTLKKATQGLLQSNNEEPKATPGETSKGPSTPLSRTKSSKTFIKNETANTSKQPSSKELAIQISPNKTNKAKKLGEGSPFTKSVLNIFNTLRGAVDGEPEEQSEGT